jgi:hypothetical protein
MAEWLVSAFADLPSKTAVAIAREIAQEAHHTNKVLLEFVERGSRSKGKLPAVVACRRTPDPRLSYRPESAYEWGPLSITIQSS